MKKIKPFIDNRWTIGIFSSLIATIIIYTFNEFFELFEWIIVWEALYFFLTYKIPLYLIFLGIIVYFLVKRYRRKKSYKNYKTDTFYGFKWSWKWDFPEKLLELSI